MSFTLNVLLFAAAILVCSSKARGQSSATPPLSTPHQLRPMDSPLPTPATDNRQVAPEPDPSNQTWWNPASSDALPTSAPSSDRGEVDTSTARPSLSAPPAGTTTALSETPSGSGLPTPRTMASTSAAVSLVPGEAGGHLNITSPPTPNTTQLTTTNQSSTHLLTPNSTQPPPTDSTQFSSHGPASSPSTHPSSAPAAKPHHNVPSELNVGDEDSTHPQRPSSPLDPLLAGLLSVFIVTTAVVSIVLFLRFRQRADHPEFHRLQDLPMDDLMEDTPLSRYTY